MFSITCCGGGEKTACAALPPPYLSSGHRKLLMAHHPKDNRHEGENHSIMTIMIDWTIILTSYRIIG